MFERNSKGYIIGKFPVTTKTCDGYKYLVTIEEGALSEYSPEAFNKVLYYFQEKLGLKVIIDNLNHREWIDAVGNNEIVEIKKRANISFTPGAKTFVQDFISKFSEEFAESSKDVFDRDLNDTLLYVLIANNGEKIHLELPYCTIEKICDSIGKIEID